MVDIPRQGQNNSILILFETNLYNWVIIADCQFISSTMLNDANPHHANAQPDEPNLPHPEISIAHQEKLLPKHLHFFWGTCHLTDDAFYNLCSFLKHTDHSWKITLWTDNVKNITNSRIFKKFGDLLPARIEIQEIWSLLELGVKKLDEHLLLVKSSKETLPQRIWTTLEATENFAFLKALIKALLTGVSAPAAANDCILPLALYCYGGYFFDLDIMATAPLPNYPIRDGLLISDCGRSVCNLAMAPHHAFALYAFLELNIVLTEKFTRFCGRTYVFFNLEAIKDRRRENRALDICNTTGLMLRLGFRCYLRAIIILVMTTLHKPTLKKPPSINQ